MAQVSMTVRMDSQVKSNFDLLCSRLGMSANTAMNLFVNAAIQHQGIPFEVRLYANSRRKDAVASLKTYTIEDINAMIDESERQLANGQWQDFDEAMNELEREFAAEKL